MTAIDRAPSGTPAVTWRPLNEGDAELLHALIRASEIADAVPFMSGLQETERELADPESTLATDTIAAVLPDGRLAAWGASRVRPEATRRRALGQDGTVHPDFRRHGLGTQVLEFTERRGRERNAAIADDIPTFLEAFGNEKWHDRRALFESRGYEPIRYYDDMRRPLSDPIPDAPLPDGLRFVAWSPALDDTLREVHNAAFRDHWGSEPLTPETWTHRVTRSPAFRADLTYGVVDGDRLVGYCTAYHFPEDAEVTGRLEGWLGQIGVVREWRGRGVASAVMCHVMRAMLAAGLEDGCLDVDSENPSGAVGLYERLGFRRHERWIRWAKPA